MPHMPTPSVGMAHAVRQARQKMDWGQADLSGTEVDFFRWLAGLPPVQVQSIVRLLLASPLRRENLPCRALECPPGFLRFY